jgi:hypothetical protein
MIRAGAAAEAAEGEHREGTRPHVATSFNPEVERPVVPESVYIDPQGVVIGNVTLGKGRPTRGRLHGGSTEGH